MLQQWFEACGTAQNTQNHDNTCTFHQFWLVFQFLLCSNREEEEKSYIPMEKHNKKAVYDAGQ